MMNIYQYTKFSVVIGNLLVISDPGHDLKMVPSLINIHNHIKKFIQKRNTMTTNVIYTDIVHANAKIQQMEELIDIMNKQIALKSERIENFQELVALLKEQVELLTPKKAV